MSDEEYTTGSVIKEPGSSKENKTGNWRSQTPIIKQNKCKGLECNQCKKAWLLCPDNAIKKGEGGFYIDYDYCKGCLICTEVSDHFEKKGGEND